MHFGYKNNLIFFLIFILGIIYFYLIDSKFLFATFGGKMGDLYLEKKLRSKF